MASHFGRLLLSEKADDLWMVLKAFVSVAIVTQKFDLVNKMVHEIVAWLIEVDCASQTVSNQNEHAISWRNRVCSFSVFFPVAVLPCWSWHLPLSQWYSPRILSSWKRYCEKMPRSGPLDRNGVMGSHHVASGIHVTLGLNWKPSENRRFTLRLYSALREGR